MKQVDAVLIGDMHLLLKEPLPKDDKESSEILVKIKLASSSQPEFQHSEPVLEV